MVSEQTKKYLLRFHGKTGTITYYILLCSPIFMLLTCCLNLYLSARWGQLSDLDLTELFKMWFGGINIDTSYPGITLKALERFETAILDMGFSILLGVLAYGAKVHRKMNVEILAALGKHHEMNLPGIAPGKRTSQ